jgi:hypothetical protein
VWGENVDCDHIEEKRRSKRGRDTRKNKNKNKRDAAATKRFLFLAFLPSPVSM